MHSVPIAVAMGQHILETQLFSLKELLNGIDRSN